MNQVPYAVVKLARDSQRPTGLDYIQNIFQNFIELHGDRRYGDAPAIVGGIAWLKETPVTVIAIEKGHTAKQRSLRNFGAPHPEGYRYVWRDGVYHTGDAAYRDKTGRYWFHGRFDDIIKTGGYRVGPYEVENVLMEHPAVVECSVIGVPDKLRGQAIKAFIVLGNREPSPELEKEIRDFCNARLAEYKWVRLIEFVSEMPKTISGKIRKTELRAAI